MRPPRVFVGNVIALPLPDSEREFGGKPAVSRLSSRYVFVGLGTELNHLACAPQGLAKRL